MEFLQDILKSKLFGIAITVAITSLILYIVRKIFHRIKEHKNSVYLGFMEGIVEAIIVILSVVSLSRLSMETSSFISTMVLSSSVIVAVLGFMFQEGTKNIVHGFFISVYKPFEIGDRIYVNTGNKEIDGFVEALTLSYTVVREAATNVRDIVPNSLMDSLTIENHSRLGREIKSGCAGMAEDGTLPNMQRFCVEITYESDIEKARQILADIVMSHPSFIDYRTDKTKPVPTYITDFLPDGIDLMVVVSADSKTSLFYEMCDIREQILAKLPEAGVEIAYPHIQVLGELGVRKSPERNDK